MRVLWFVEKPLPAVERRLGTSQRHHGSWLDQLEVSLRCTPDLTLGIASLASQAQFQYEPFESEGVVYYGLGPVRRSPAHVRVAERWRRLARLEEELSGARKIIEEFRPDLVHVHGTENRFGLLAGQNHPPVVTSIQGILSVYEIMDVRGMDTSLLLSSSPSLFLRGTGTLLNHAALRRKAARERVIVRQGRHFIGRTRFDADFIRVLNPDASYHHCDELLRPEFRGPVWDQSRSHPHTVYGYGAFYARKGLGTLLKAIALLREALVPDIRLRLAGMPASESEERHALAREIRRLHLSGCVTISGVHGPASLVGELLGAAVFALPTHADNSPNSLAEAMMIGTPSVASAVGGIPTLARDGIEALLVQDGDPYSLAGAILRLFEDGGLARTLSRNARAAALARHDPDRVRETLLGIYHAVLADERLPRA